MVATHLDSSEQTAEVCITPIYLQVLDEHIITIEATCKRIGISSNRHKIINAIEVELRYINHLNIAISHFLNTIVDVVAQFL